VRVDVDEDDADTDTELDTFDRGLPPQLVSSGMLVTSKMEKSRRASDSRAIKHAGILSDAKIYIVVFCAEHQVMFTMLSIVQGAKATLIRESLLSLHPDAMAEPFFEEFVSAINELVH
jgi:hypothetical protein